MAFYFQHDTNLFDAVDHDWSKSSGRHAEERAESDFEVNVRAEKEIEVILMHLEQQNELILKILENTKK